MIPMTDRTLLFAQEVHAAGDEGTPVSGYLRLACCAWRSETRNARARGAHADVQASEYSPFSLNHGEFQPQNEGRGVPL